MCLMIIQASINTTGINEKTKYGDKTHNIGMPIFAELGVAHKIRARDVKNPPLMVKIKSLIILNKFFINIVFYVINYYVIF